MSAFDRLRTLAVLQDIPCATGIGEGAPLGIATANDVVEGLSEQLCNAAVRSMLNRLVRKGLLTRAKCGRRGAIVYGPALTDALAREFALKQFAEDFFEGSLEKLAKAVARMPSATSSQPH